MVAAAEGTTPEPSPTARRGRGATRKPRMQAGAAKGKVAGTRPRTSRPASASASTSASASAGQATPLRIPYGNKDVAMQLGARYRDGQWHAPAGVDLDPFRSRGWL
jgi:DNA topoisomerase-3